MPTPNPIDKGEVPFQSILTFRAPGPMIAALTSRALVEKVDRSVVIRRLIRLGAEVEGLDLTGLGPIKSRR